MWGEDNGQPRGRETATYERKDEGAYRMRKRISRARETKGKRTRIKREEGCELSVPPAGGRGGEKQE